MITINEYINCIVTPNYKKLIARKDIIKNTIILKDKGFYYQTKNIHYNCSSCLKILPNINYNICKYCHKYFCSNNDYCLNNYNNHYKICEYCTKNNIKLDDTSKMIIELSYLDSDLFIDYYNNLAKYPCRDIKNLKHIKFLLNPIIKLKMSDKINDIIYNYFGLMRKNLFESFRTSYSNQNSGYLLLKYGSYFNHKCNNENTVFNTLSDICIFKTIKNVKKGEELTITYMNLFNNTREMKNKKLGFYCFNKCCWNHLNIPELYFFYLKPYQKYKINHLLNNTEDERQLFYSYIRDLLIVKQAYISNNILKLCYFFLNIQPNKPKRLLRIIINKITKRSFKKKFWINKLRYI